MALRIRTSNLNKKRRLPEKEIKKAVLKVLRHFRVDSAVIDITFVSDRKIIALNKKYMKRNGATDVISFSLKDKRLPRGGGVIGDIYISSDTAYKNSIRFNTRFKKELVLCAIHGALHALGFGDKTRKEKVKIRKLEDKFLKWQNRI